MQREKIKTYAIIFLVAILAGTLYLGRAYPQKQIVGGTQSTSTIAANDFPTLVLPSTYFLNSTIVGEEVDTTSPNYAKGMTDNNPPWTSATINSGDDYQTYPTTTISLKDYSNSPPSSSGGYSIGSKKTFSVEGDSSQETIEVLCSVGSMDGYCGEAQIVKGGTVIFSASSDFVDILPSPTGNGFYVKSENDLLEPSRAGVLGYVKTRFVYDGKEFKPIYEQTVYYLNVQNGTSTSL